MRRLSAAAIVLLVISGPTVRASCDDDTIQSVSGDGSIIVMVSGAVYRVSAADTVDSALWQPSDDVLICDDDTIINTDEDGEKVDVVRLR